MVYEPLYHSREIATIKIVFWLFLQSEISKDLAIFLDYFSQNNCSTHACWIQEDKSFVGYLSSHIQRRGRGIIVKYTSCIQTHFAILRLPVIQIKMTWLLKVVEKVN